MSDSNDPAGSLYKYQVEIFEDYSIPRELWLEHASKKRDALLAWVKEYEFEHLRKDVLSIFQQKGGDLCAVEAVLRLILNRVVFKVRQDGFRERRWDSVAACHIIANRLVGEGNYSRQ